MKKFVLLAVFFLLSSLVAASALQAQRQNLVKLNPLSAFARHINVSYERAITEKSSAQLGFLAGGIAISFLESDRLSYSGWGLTGEYRFYLTGPTQLSGFYVAPHFLMRNYTAKGTYEDAQGQYEATAKIRTMGGGVTAGYQFLVSDVFSLELLLGPQFRSRSIKVSAEGRSGDQSIEEDSISPFIAGQGIGLRFGMTIGFAF